MKQNMKIYLIIIFITAICSNYLYASNTMLKWEASTGFVLGYSIHYGTSEGDYSFNKDVGNVTQYSIDNLLLDKGATYYFVVRAYNDIGISDNSNSVTYMVPDTEDVTPPLSPTDLMAQAQNDDILLTWKENSDLDISRYRVYYGTSSRDYGLPIPEDGIQNLITGLDTDVRYYFAITAVDTSGNESGYSNEVSFIIDSEVVVPANVSFYWDMENTTAQDLTNKDDKIVSLIGLGELTPGAAKSGGYGFDTITDGSNSYAQIKINDSDILNAEKGSIQFWFNHQTLSGYKYLGILYGDADNYMILSVEGASTYKLLHLKLNLGGTNYSTTGPDSYFINEWIKIRISWNLDENYLKFYINDNLVGENSSVTGNWSTLPIEVRLGASWNVIDCYIDELYISDDPDNLFQPDIPIDTINPTVAIVLPTLGNTYAVETSKINISGTASDDIGVTQVFWNNSAGGSGTASGTNNWSVSGISLSKGENIITITARDDAVNEATDQLIVEYVTDETAPLIIINSPTSDSDYNTDEPVINISGTASDNKGVTQVTWSNSLGDNGIATGTTNWSVPGISLSEGENIITIIASDAVGNTSFDSIVINYQPILNDSWTILKSDDFESGWGNYIDGGWDCSLSADYKKYAHQGDYCVRLQDNSGESSSFFSATGIDVATAGYTEIKIEFWYYPFSFEAGEDFFVEYYDGSNIHIIGQYVVGRDFNNGSLYHEEGIILKEGSPLIFPNNMRIRIRCDASGNYDKVYIDDVIISAR